MNAASPPGKPTVDDLARLGREMRTAQTDYFAARRKGIDATELLRASKGAEKAFDAAIADHFEPPDLFA